MRALNDARILHLACDEKFIDMAIAAFQRQGPRTNHLCLYAHGMPQRVRTPPEKLHDQREALVGVSPTFLAQYDILVVHSLHPAFFRTILNAPPSVHVVWIGWGYDYYDLIFAYDAQALLIQTLSVESSHRRKMPWRSRAKQWLEKVSMPSKCRVVARINHFSPVLPNEYPMVACACRGFPFPAPIRWNYGTLEDDLLHGLVNRWVEGDAILLGNSAAYSCNHWEAMQLLAQHDSRQEVIVPLSYGSPANREALLAAGAQMLRSRFVPLIQFMALQDYNAHLLRCGYAVMNHVRQQAVGNIVVMLYLGARVFLREECASLDFFRAAGAIVNTVQQLDREPWLIQTPLPPDERATNRRVTQAYWSREVSAHNTRQLIAVAMGQTEPHRHVAS